MTRIDAVNHSHWTIQHFDTDEGWLDSPEYVFSAREDAERMLGILRPHDGNYRVYEVLTDG